MATKKNSEKTVTKTSAAKSEKIRIRLKAYDHVVLEPILLRKQEQKFQDLFHFQQKRKL